MSMNARIAAASAVLALVPAVVGAGGHQPKPPDTTVVTLGPRSIEIWPYTGENFSGTPSDPINLFFVNTDPRALRQALLGLDANRPQIAPVPLPIDHCIWMDGMGNEQTAWGEVHRWVGGEVQLVCALPGYPLGQTFRFHVRLFRQGRDTLGAAHFELRVPGTGEHRVLSWDLARDFVAAEMERVRPGMHSETIPLITPGTFRTVDGLLYGELIKDPGLAYLLGFLGINPAVHDGLGNPLIPTTGDAIAFAPHLRHGIKRDRSQASTTIEYNVTTPRPFCNTGPYDFVHLSGTLEFNQAVSVDRQGEYRRRYDIAGDLIVVPVNPLTGEVVGPPTPAHVEERHRARLDNHGGQLTERASQELLGSPGQKLSWFLAAGHLDRYSIEVVCE
jgi:hypothetical protein